MSVAANQPPAAGSHKSNWILLGFVAVAMGAVAVFFYFDQSSGNTRDPLFHGAPESEWINGLKYNDDEQVKEWRGYGEPGVQVLIRGLERANRPGERIYRQLYRRSPELLAHWLPAPKNDSTRALRMTLVSLLASLGHEAKSATPIMTQLLNRDEADSVRQLVINFFNSSEDEKCVLNQMSDAEKKALLPAFLRDAQNQKDWGLRNNATIALGWYPEQRKTVAPVLMGAMHDPQPQVVLVAMTALTRVAPDLITNASAATIVAEILKNPDDQIAYRAAELLGKMHAEPSVAVPALIGALTNASRLVVVDSASALIHFDQPAELILPALTSVMQRKDFPGYLKPNVQRKIDLLTAKGKGTG